MKKPEKTVRIVVRLPEELVLRACRVAPRSLRLDTSRLLERALGFWTDARREHLDDLAVGRMGKDPKLLAQCRRISQEFAGFEGDGLEGS